eukprot:gnl/Chilomastix_cuspidata/3226.p1 GENE.gnl/Chilomastix_cuspidata/3226~~gnl/Chilomastix_cuspidata/3226.p1  ORF type:complete len:415 (-),score=171.36 gnl/Chilomastix_cuspidata/3226:52-1266(-)
MLALVFALALILAAPLARALPIVGNSPDDLLADQGFSLQKSHHATEDGYILEFWRLNDAYTPLADEDLAARPPVGILHGIADLGTVFSLNYRNNSLALMLFDLGFDVWAVNFRGNDVSTSHEWLATDSDEYWDFDFDESARYDLPLFIDTILANSEAPDVALACHSMGCTALYAFLASASASAREFDFAKVRAAATLAPVVYASNMSGALSVLPYLPEELTVEIVFDLFGVQDVFPHEWFDPWAAEVCYVLPELCNDVISLIGGSNPDPAAVDPERLYLYLNVYPAGASTRSFAHFIQIADAGDFLAYDYGAGANLLRYGSQRPPEYDLNDIPEDIPIFLIGGTADGLADAVDTQRLYEKLSEIDRNDFRFLSVEGYTHQDMVWAMNAPEMVYNDVISFFFETL